MDVAQDLVGGRFGCWPNQRDTGGRGSLPGSGHQPLIIADTNRGRPIEAPASLRRTYTYSTAGDKRERRAVKDIVQIAQCRLGDAGKA
jgi:hypothetical protein